MTAPPRYKRPFSVLVVVHTRSGEVLLLRRRDPPDFWQSVTGSLREGESPAEAAARELAEETGIAHAGLVDCGITHRFPMDRYREAIETFGDKGRSGAIKIVLEHD